MQHSCSLRFSILVIDHVVSSVFIGEVDTFTFSFSYQLNTYQFYATNSPLTHFIFGILTL